MSRTFVVAVFLIWWITASVLAADSPAVPAPGAAIPKTVPGPSVPPGLVGPKTAPPEMGMATIDEKGAISVVYTVTKFVAELRKKLVPETTADGKTVMKEVVYTVTKPVNEWRILTSSAGEFQVFKDGAALDAKARAELLRKPTLVAYSRYGDKLDSFDASYLGLLRPGTLVVCFPLTCAPLGALPSGVPPPTRPNPKPPPQYLPPRLVPGRLDEKGRLVIREYRGAWLEGRLHTFAVDGVFPIEAVGLFASDGRPIDTDTAKQRLAKWTPVLVFGAPAGAIKKQPIFAVADLGVFDESLVVAAVPVEAGFAQAAARIEKEVKSRAPRRPGLARVSLNSEGGLVGQVIVWKLTTEDKKHGPAEPKGDDRKADEVLRWEAKPSPVGAIQFAPMLVKVFDGEGNAVDAGSLPQLIPKETTVVLSTENKMVDPFYLKAAKKGTLVVVPPSCSPLDTGPLMGMPAATPPQPTPAAPPPKPAAAGPTPAKAG